jgi:hypothetical protein
MLYWRHQALLEERFMIAQRKGHPRGSRLPTIKEYARFGTCHCFRRRRWDGVGFRGCVDGILKDKGFTRRVGVSVHFYSVVPPILQQRALLPRGLQRGKASRDRRADSAFGRAGAAWIS